MFPRKPLISAILEAQLFFKSFVSVDVSVSVEMEKIEYQTKMDAVYGNSAPSFAIVKFWATELGLGHTNLIGRP